MATIYKRKQDKGKKRSCWYIGYTDYAGKRVTRKGFSDKGETERLAAKLEDESRLVRDGVIKPSQTQQGKQKTIPLSDHLEAFERYLKNRDAGKRHIKETTQKVKRIIAECKLRYVDDINAESVENFLGCIRSEGISKQTSNHYLRAIKQFSSWLVRTKRVNDNPLAHIPILNVQTDRRHDRRALVPEEFNRLIKAAEQGKSIQSILGSDRSMMYILSAWTGYRKGEIGSLTLNSFDLENDPPTVTVQAIYSKRKRTDTQVLHPDIVNRFQEWLSEKTFSRDELLFPVSHKSGGTERKTSKMMKVDLQAARNVWITESESEKERSEREASDFLCYQDHQGRYADFHANRHTFITNLAKAGVSPKTAQTLARHSDIRLTMNVYSHTDLAEKTAAVSQLPKLWERSGSAPVSQIGIDVHKTSSDKEEAKEKADEEPSAEPVVLTELNIKCHNMTLIKKLPPFGIEPKTY